MIKVKLIPIEKILGSSFQPRKEFDEQSIEDLARSIETSGLLHPLIVRPCGDKYELMAGEMRLRACRDLLKWTHVPAFVMEGIDDDYARLISLSENLFRTNLSDKEKEEAIYEIYTRFKERGMSQEEISKMLGYKSQSTISMYVKAHEERKKLKLSAADIPTRAIVKSKGLEDRERRKLLNKVAEKKIESSEVPEYVKELKKVDREVQREILKSEEKIEKNEIKEIAKIEDKKEQVKKVKEIEEAKKRAKEALKRQEKLRKEREREERRRKKAEEAARKKKQKKELALFKNVESIYKSIELLTARLVEIREMENEELKEGILKMMENGRALLKKYIEVIGVG
ncbi:MAG: ParB/RepB/Spo0J family partition protein [Candidatus Helarchaeales archaeon]